MSAFRVAQSITAAIRANGIKGPIQITAFGDVFQLSRGNQEALSSTGINIAHIPHVGFVSHLWTMAISSVESLVLYTARCLGVFVCLRSICYDIKPVDIFGAFVKDPCLASHDSPYKFPSMCPYPCDEPEKQRAAEEEWNALVKGENLTGKHFNQPPDGPYGSWYGHYKAPLEDPFASTEAPACPRVEEQSESVAEPKLRPVPMVVMKQILKILKACPKGISITDFRSELGKSNIQTEANGQFFLRGAASKVPEPGESSLGISTGCTTNTGDPAEPAPALSPKINDGDASCRSTVHEKPSTSLDAKVNAKEPIKKVQGTSKRREDKAPKVPDPPPIFDNMSKAEAMGSHMHPMDNQEPISEVGFFSRVWRKWFGGKDSSSEQKTCGKPENCSMLSQKPEKSKETNEKFVKSAPSCADQEIINWCKFWRSREMRENPSEEEESRKGNQIDIDAEKQEIFTRESFWNDVASFIQAPKGSNLIFQSRTSKIPYEALVPKTHKPLYKCQNNVGMIILIKVELEMVRVGWRTRCSTLVLC
ncbi:hypothetical protein RJ639_042937 [Escallonia herrerae]|uniref:Uncharacterized protein n=1 Tax=Escallonia herrerae TaxID=1293975 RepID=A0AA88WDN8_9ASTE|nr:hypothetical protein RJ639_042937 [Escallonia herrerae]